MSKITLPSTTTRAKTNKLDKSQINQVVGYINRDLPRFTPPNTHADTLEDKAEDISVALGFKVTKGNLHSVLEWKFPQFVQPLNGQKIPAHVAKSLALAAAKAQRINTNIAMGSPVTSTPAVVSAPVITKAPVQLNLNLASAIKGRSLDEVYNKLDQIQNLLLAHFTPVQS